MKISMSAETRVAVLRPLLLLLVLGATSIVFSPGAAAPDRCPPGQDPLPFVHLAAVPLPADVPPYSKMAMSRIILEPGGTLDFAPEGFTAYYVESGALTYLADRPGFAISESPQCESPDGHYSSGGHFAIDSEGMGVVRQGQALISDAIPTGPISNRGDVPLVMLQVRLVLPMIDPESGEPIPDSVVLARATAREREQRKQACRAAASASVAGDVVATPTLVPIAPAEDIKLTRPPRACKKPRT